MKFNTDIINLLAQYGYKTEGIKDIYIECGITKVPSIQIEYYEMEQEVEE